MSGHPRPADCWNRLQQPDRAVVFEIARRQLGPARAALGLSPLLLNRDRTAIVEGKLANLLAFHWVKAGYGTPEARSLGEVAFQLESGRFSDRSVAVDFIGDVVLADAIAHREEQAVVFFADRFHHAIQGWFRRFRIPWLATADGVEGYIDELAVEKAAAFGSFDGAHGLEPWLKSIIENASKDILRSHKRELRRNKHAASTDPDCLIAHDREFESHSATEYDEVADLLADNELGSLLLPIAFEAICSLTPQQTTLLRLKYSDKRVYQNELAMIMGISESSLSRQIERAEATIGTSLERLIEESPHREEFEPLLERGRRKMSPSEECDDSDESEEFETRDEKDRRALTSSEACLARTLGVALRAVAMVEDSLESVPKRNRESLHRGLALGKTLRPAQRASLAKVGSEVRCRARQLTHLAIVGPLAEDAESQNARFHHMVFLVLNRPEDRRGGSSIK